MRGLIFKTINFYAQDLEKSNWPPAIKGKQDFDGRKQDFHNVICVWLCVEQGDLSSYIDSLIARIDSLNHQFYNLREIVVLPFGHLSHNLAGPDLTRQLIDELVSKLRQGGLVVEKLSFGTHKAYGFDMAGHRAATSYFEFPYDGHKPDVA